jgi:hypothetical protein
MNNYKYVACAPSCSCCPDIEVDDGIVYITDDQKMVVQMSVEEFKMLAEDFIHRYNNILEVQQGPL